MTDDSVILARAYTWGLWSDRSPRIGMDLIFGDSDRVLSRRRKASPWAKQAIQRMLSEGLLRRTGAVTTDGERIDLTAAGLDMVRGTTALAQEQALFAVASTHLTRIKLTAHNYRNGAGDLRARDTNRAVCVCGWADAPERETVAEAKKDATTHLAPLVEAELASRGLL